MCLRLKDLCLDTIVDKFDLFNSAFCTTENLYIKREFEFLQRKYSLDILTQLSDTDSIQEKYISLLVNKYLKVFETVWFRNCLWETVIDKIEEIGSNIEKINIQDVYFEEFCEETPWQDIICHLPNLKSFTFHDDCHDLILKNVANFCPDIEEINIENSCVTFDAVKYICMKESGKSSCTKLKVLHISGTPIRDDGIKHLIKNLPSLENIDYPDLPAVLHSLHKNDLATLDKVQPYNITALDLSNFAHSPFFSSLLKVCLSVCPHLKSLICPLTNKDDMTVFSNLPNLEKLHLECYSDSKIDVSDLLKSKGGKLTYLTIENCIISISVLAENCPRVQDLCLDRVQFRCDDNSKLIFNSLVSCTFEYVSQDPSTAKVVSLLLLSSPKLESISFRNCSLSPEIKAHILKCCEKWPIKIISFRASVVEKEYIKDVLLNCHSLNGLNLEDCYFTAGDEDELHKFAEILSNKPYIEFNDPLSISDYEDEYLNGNYEIDDYDYDYDSYDDYCDGVGYDEYDDDDDDDSD